MDQNNMEQLSSTVSNLVKGIEGLSAIGSIDSREAVQLKKAINIASFAINAVIAKDQRHEIVESHEEFISDDQLFFIRDSINLLQSGFMSNSEGSNFKNVVELFTLLMTNLSAALGGIKLIDESVNSCNMTIATIDSFRTLIIRTERLIHLLDRFENQSKLAPTVAAHMMKIINDDLNK